MIYLEKKGINVLQETPDTDQEHVSNLPIEEFNRIVGEVLSMSIGPVLERKQASTQVTLRDLTGVIVFKDDDKFLGWIMDKDWYFIEDFVSEQDSVDFRYGYIDGRISHLGPTASRGMTSANIAAGYTIWIENK